MDNVRQTDKARALHYCTRPYTRFFLLFAENKTLRHVH